MGASAILCLGADTPANRQLRRPLPRRQGTRLRGSRIDDYGLQTGTAVGGAVRDLGPGALQADGDNRINGIMGAMVRFTPTVPEPQTHAMILAEPDRTRTRGRMRRPTP